MFLHMGFLGFGQGRSTVTTPALSPCSRLRVLLDATLILVVASLIFPPRLEP